MSVRSRLTPHWPSTTRRRVAAVVALLAIVLATSIASARLLRLIFDDLDLLAYASLFVACWIGAGGALVPVPGVRPVSWLLIIQQGGTLDPLVVTLVAAGAMVLGQSSYFLAARAASRRHAASAGRPDEQPEAKPPGRMARARLRVERLVRDHGMATVLVVSALPSPFTTVATTAAAVEEMSYSKFALAAGAGYLVLCAVLSLVGDGILDGLRTTLFR